jgi:hypothetical protein
VITNAKVPASDSRRSRACFVHPVYGLDGEVLTESFPKDHYHHHGIFWSWPHVGIDGKEYDLWMYNNIQQRFVRWIAREADPASAARAAAPVAANTKIVTATNVQKCRNREKR